MILGLQGYALLHAHLFNQIFRIFKLEPFGTRDVQITGDLSSEE